MSDFSWGSAPDSAGKAYSAPTDHLPVFKGTYFKEEGGERKGQDWKGEGRLRRGWRE